MSAWNLPEILTDASSVLQVLLLSQFLTALAQYHTQLKHVRISEKEQSLCSLALSANIYQSFPKIFHVDLSFSSVFLYVHSI